MSNFGGGLKLIASTNTTTTYYLFPGRDFGLGDEKQCAQSKMTISRQLILAKAKGTDATTLRIVLNVKAEVYEQPTPHSTEGACAIKQCDPPFMEHLNFGSSDMQLI